MENILADVTAVKREAEFGGFRPDILVKEGQRPIFLEFTHTSPTVSSEASLLYRQSALTFLNWMVVSPLPIARY